MELAAIFLSRTALEVYAVIALALFALGLKHNYDEHRRDEGRAEFAAVATACHDALTADSPSSCAAAIGQTVADNAQLKTNVDGLQKTIDTQNLSLQRLADAGNRARANAAAASKQAEANAADYAKRQEALRPNIEQPAKDPNADADRILRALAIDRLRGH